MRIVHCIDAVHAGGIADLILNLHRNDSQNTHDVWAYKSGHATEMEKYGQRIYEGGIPGGERVDVVVGHGVGGWSYDNTFGYARKSWGAKTIEVMHSPARSLTDSASVDAFVGVANVATRLNLRFNIVQTIYPMVDPALFDITERGDFIGRLSRLVPEKCPDQFLEIARRIPNRRFVMAGDGPMAGQLARMKPGNVEMPGWTRDFRRFFSRLHLFVFPTRDECACMSVAMAQAAGLPVICQDIEALHETTGNLVAYASGVDDFAAEVERLEAAGVRNSEGARSWARYNFHPESVVPKWQSLLKNL